MGTRNRAFAVFRRVVLDQRFAIDHQAIAGGNLYSHAGNVLADCQLFQETHPIWVSTFDISMETWDPSAKWPEKFGGCTLKVRELKPNLTSLVAGNKDGNSSQLGKDKTVRASWLETIPSPPERWTAKSNEKSNEIRDHRSLIVECEYPMWKVANILWKLKRGGSLVEDATVYIDCALKVYWGAPLPMESTIRLLLPALRKIHKASAFRSSWSCCEWKCWYQKNFYAACYRCSQTTQYHYVKEVL